MATQSYYDGPEVSVQYDPEVLPPLPSQPYPALPPPTSISYAGSPVLSTDKVDGSLIAVPPAAQYQYPHYYNALASQDGVNDGNNGNANRGQRLGPFGCTMAVFWLSATIAVLVVAVAGLAAGTGIEANRANNAEKSLARISSADSTTTTACPAAASASSTSFASIDMGCSNMPDTVTGSRYTSFAQLGQQTFTIHCNKDAQGGPLLSVFVADFETCIDACSGYTKYITSTFHKSNSNTTCGGVSFIPAWTDKASATKGNAPGNCYLKPSPQNTTSLQVPKLGELLCHAATLNST